MASNRTEKKGNISKTEMRTRQNQDIPNSNIIVWFPSSLVELDTVQRDSIFFPISSTACELLIEKSKKKAIQQYNNYNNTNNNATTWGRRNMRSTYQSNWNIATPFTISYLISSAAVSVRSPPLPISPAANLDVLGCTTLTQLLAASCSCNLTTNSPSL